MDKQDQLKSILSLLSSSVTKSEVTDAFKVLMDFVKGIKSGNEQEWALIKSAVTMLGDKLSKENTSKLEKELARVEKTFTASIQKALKEQQDGMNFIYDKVAGLKDGKDGEPGRDAPPISEIVAATIKQLPEDPEETAEEIAGKLETLEGEARLDAKAIKNLPEATKEIITRAGGARGVQLYVGGAKKGLAQYVNLIAGANITLSYAYANGRNDITITGGAGASLTPIAMTGTIDDTNVDFTAASEPTIVVINGASYRNGKGVTISGTTITLDSPVGSNGDLYGL